jgi:cell division protein FtsZ
MGTGVGTGENRATGAAEASIANPLLDESSMQGAKGVLVSISGGIDMTLFEIDEAVSRIREEVGDDSDIIVGAIFDQTLEGKFQMSVVATGLEAPNAEMDSVLEIRGNQTQGLQPVH